MSYTASAQALGLDIGTSRLVVARRQEQDVRYESQLNAFVSIPFSKITEGALQRERVPHTVVPGEIIVQGNESEKFAGLLNAEIRRPMTRGVLDPKEPSSLSVLRELYGLSRREADVVEQILLGRPLDEAAQALGIHLETVRMHLKQVFQKVGTRRQVDLVRLLLTGVSSLHWE